MVDIPSINAAPHDDDAATVNYSDDLPDYDYISSDSPDLPPVYPNPAENGILPVNASTADITGCPNDPVQADSRLVGQHVMQHDASSRTSCGSRRTLNSRYSLKPSASV